ncbi:4-(cytidine 5'-diphospho)-2-C-methyl-D-erythritol kinase [Clostridium senegalense]|uniref:4-(cytidine 5'-diphospho)-2-C-methyl-D-erythritol kinase n=1 Tax=Clostridium senegalense TaxID=1465809 RepID=UPI001C120CAB|nr:4-(cytidine 5'-diphospho)-2-C-methyl-D-erythritol kinase [Clostridium senegalense]MBU5227466.1 4-(cytidine 5'-diphospho)-2-C-methyl-D-erythritol kinase [Clostridium senegalense]
MKVKAYGKINIALDVVGKREDGYHLLKMIMQTVDIYDELEFEKCDKNITINCNKKYLPVDENNLVYKAIKLFMEKYNISSGVKVNIVKNIPVAAGMAGGSADAAATLKAMRNMFKKDVTDGELMELGLKIGADVPYCIVGGTALCEGVGEVVTKLKPFKNKILVVVKPNFGVSTKDVYKALEINKIHKHPETEKLITAMKQENIKYVSKNMRNVLENVTIKKHLLIKQLKEEMMKNGALGSMMSGSGPTVFGFFEDMLKAQDCYDKLKEKYRDCYITRTI